ncbi:hypothetical protein ACIBK9_47465 [Nonomuraea sp. NPDC050227]|uniref:hypothetical protein n=1 Tax=Nonomuraea sp. NPDC050227 TaxID=3364360 RepID=UPI0037B4F661
MTAIIASAPDQAALTPEVGRVLDALALYAYTNQLDQGGRHARAALIVAVLASLGIDAADALDLVEYGGDLVRDIRPQVDALIDQARRADLAAQMGEVLA